MDKCSDNDLTAERGRLNSLAWKILLPVAIGIGVVAWLFHREFDIAVLDMVRIDVRTICGIVLALLFVIGRDFGLSWRFRELTDRSLSWYQSVKVSLLCEFTSCITPSAVGGSALSMVYMHREGIEYGRGTILMMTTLLLDELFFVISLPMVMLSVSYSELFGFVRTTFSAGLEASFWTVYALIALWTLILFIGILVKPRTIRITLNRLFSVRLLHRWAARADGLGKDIESTGHELCSKSARWWAKAFGATAVTWLSRYLVVNALFFGFAPMADGLTVFARQFVVWALLMVSPTPGGAGISEWLFTTYYGDMIDSTAMVLAIALLWRIVSYYIYLLIGACIVPSWIRKGFKHDKKTSI